MSVFLHHCTCVYLCFDYTMFFENVSDFSKLVMIFDILAGRLELFLRLMLFRPELWRDTSERKLK